MQTEDGEKAKRVSKKLRSGIVYVNHKPADPGTPFGGYRQSGNGREGGNWGLIWIFRGKNNYGMEKIIRLKNDRLCNGWN